MICIKLNEHIKEAATKQSGEWLKAELEKYMAPPNNNSIKVDFDRIDKFSSQFFNNSFSALIIKNKGKEFLSNIEIANLSETGKFLFESSIGNALMLLEHIDKRDEMSRIVNNTPKKVE